MTDSSNKWLRRFHPAPDSPARLVCFPHAGGSATFYHPASAHFTPDVDVVALQYPGRQDRRRERLVDSIPALADLVAAELTHLDERPTVFFGHSMGAVLAFETAWRLEQQHSGTAPRALVLSGRRGPSTTRRENVHESDDNGLLAELKRLGGTDLGLMDDEMLQTVLPAIRNDYRAIETYRCPPDRTVRCPMTVLTGDADPKTTVPEAEAWHRHTEGEFRVEVFEGGHFYLVNHQEAVNAEISRELRSISPATGRAR
ncbi:alpha/beta fold hydrolase [Saccharopolyspora indica]|uniref:thioesterase II family protein n=1 Tax=Saccharopolyspora indica TaxID=1229659 RepID=UPI0022EB2334|nr:alpha/beta fold hydrolase [Saccharopolyspora indica]MDA3647977.1 alpha/beta fold hydrolase [Saccharopolyspora indica]